MILTFISAFVFQAAAISDTGRPAAPEGLHPPAAPLLAPKPADTSEVYYRNFIGILFHDSTSGTTVRSVLARHNTTILGGYPKPHGTGEYFVLIPDPGSFAGLEGAVRLIAHEPGVLRVSMLEYRTHLDIRSGSPGGDDPAAWPRLTTNFPKLDPDRTTVLPGGTALYYRTDAMVVFEATTTDVEKAAILSGVGATVLGVTPGGVSLIHFPDPGLPGQALRDFLGKLRSTPGVNGASPIPFTEPGHWP